MAYPAEAIHSSINRDLEQRRASRDRAASLMAAAMRMERPAGVPTLDWIGALSLARRVVAASPYIGLVTAGTANLGQRRRAKRIALLLQRMDHELGRRLVAGELV